MAKRVVIDTEECLGCGASVELCPGFLHLVKRKRKRK